MSINSSKLNSSDILSFNDFLPSSTKMNINRHLSLYSPVFSTKNQDILNTYLNNNKLLKKKNSLDFTLNNKKRRKSYANNLNISSNNPSTYETSFSNSIFDMKSPQLKNINISNILQNKVLINLRPKSDYNKIKLDIILGYTYFISKEKQNKNQKKIEKFIFKTQKNFDEKIKIFIQNNSEKKVEGKNNKKSANESKNMNTINQEIKNIAKIFHKFENVMTIYGLIIYYLIKAKKENEAKIIYLLIIKQNMKHIKYLEEIINFKELLTDKFGKYKLKIYRYANAVLLKIYSNLIKYGFLFNLSFYGNLFTKMYLSLSHKYYLYSLANHKIKYSSTETIKLTKNWFSYLNYYSAYFTVANYCSMKIPINLYNSALNVYNTIDEQSYDMNDKNIILSSKYNKGLLLYLNGENDEAINTLKDLKINLFSYIEDNYIGKKGINKKYTKTKSFIAQEITDHINKGKNKENFEKKLSSSFNKIFNNIISSKNSKNNTNYKNRQYFNVNIKFEPFFISNIPINLENFVNMYVDLCGITIQSNRKDNKHPSIIGLIKKIPSTNNPSERKTSLQELDTIERLNQINIPNIFQMPLLIRTELLIAEIELDKKHKRSAYTFTNHAMAIISIFKRVKNTFLLNKYKEEQKYIKEFLNIIDNSDVINESDIEEREEEEEKDNEKEIISTARNIEYKKQIEFKERVNLNKKVLKELEKFFIFFMNLSVYQIKVLNETQPKTEIKNYLPILFQNQFKDCLSLRQSVELENLDIMSLSRYMILKDPNKLILPGNLNITKEYLEKPELFKTKVIKTEEKNKKKKRKEEEELNKKANLIFKQLIKSVKNKQSLFKLLNRNHNIVLKLIKFSNNKEIKKMMENPESLIKPIEKYQPKNKSPTDFNRRGYTRMKSQILNNSLISGFRIKTDTNNNKREMPNFFHKTLQKDLFNNSIDDKKNDINTRKSMDKLNTIFKNKNKKNKKFKKNKKIDSYNSSFKLSVSAPSSDAEAAV